MEVKFAIQAGQYMDIVKHLQQHFQRIFNIHGSVEIVQLNIKKQYNYLRKQYDAEKIMAALKEKFPPKRNTRVIAVFPVDAYVEGLNFVFGIAEENWGGIVFTQRLNPELYGLPFHPLLYYTRITKVALHEFGHSIGLNHCNNPSCIMWFDNSIEDVDRKSLNYCLNCRIIITRKYPNLLRL